MPALGFTGSGAVFYFLDLIFVAAASSIRDKFAVYQRNHKFSQITTNLR